MTAEVIEQRYRQYLTARNGAIRYGRPLELEPADHTFSDMEDNKRIVRSSISDHKHKRYGKK